MSALSCMQQGRRAGHAAAGKAIWAAQMHAHQAIFQCCASLALHALSCPLPPVSLAAALASGDIDGAAKMIANASAQAIATAATLAPTQGLTQQLAQASVLAVTKYGASATAVAAALSQVRCQCQ